MSTFFLFGLFDVRGLRSDGQMSSVLKERLIVLGAVMVVLLIVLAWAVLFRRKRLRAARRSDRRHRRQSFARNAAKGMSEIKKLATENPPGRRRRHRPRNPTLAETGGLPPVREATPPPRTPPA
jgi:hypothetical protein